MCCTLGSQTPDKEICIQSVGYVLEAIAQSMREVGSPTIGKLFHDFFLL